MGAHTCLENANFAAQWVTDRVRIVHMDIINMMMTISIVYSADLPPMAHAPIIARMEIINTAAALTDVSIADQLPQAHAQIIAHMESTKDKHQKQLIAD